MMAQITFSTLGYSIISAKFCWTHWLMIMGTLFTFSYAVLRLYQEHIGVGNEDAPERGAKFDYAVVGICLLANIALMATRGCALDICICALWLGIIAIFTSVMNLRKHHQQRLLANNPAQSLEPVR